MDLNRPRRRPYGAAPNLLTFDSNRLSQENSFHDRAAALKSPLQELVHGASAPASPSRDSSVADFVKSTESLLEHVRKLERKVGANEKSIHAKDKTIAELRTEIEKLKRENKM